MRIRFDTKKPVVLAIDDIDVNLHMIENVLGKGVQVIKRDSGRGGLDYMDGNHVDIVLLDYNMPGMSGVDVLDVMKRQEKTRNIPVIILTAETDIDIETEVFRRGAVDFIRKPFSPMVVRERVRRVLENEHFNKMMRQEVERQTRLAEERLATIERLFNATIMALVQTIDAKDPYTQGHSLRVAEYSRRIAELAGMDVEQQQEIYCMGLLHDIGKIGIPDAIINKPAKLTDEEIALIKSHTIIGANILGKIDHSPKLSFGARSHHEKWDGTGYPEGLKGEEIACEARLIAVADSYDAMTSRRSYRDIIEQSVVRREIEQGRGTQFDPQFADIMLQMIDEDVYYRMRADRFHGNGANLL